LDNLEGREEWGVKVYCDFNMLKMNLIKEDGEIKKMDGDIESSSEGRAYLLRKKRDDLLEKMLNRKINEYGQDSFEKLKTFSIDTRINKIKPREVTGREDEMILNTAFLLEKNKIKDLLYALNYLKVKYNDKGLYFNCTVPWPPHNFCSIKKEGAI
ncbi:MAG: GvpL/GvpF family gas vesicle protein, partial [Nitrospinota bacterium]